jgi:hypothetical protein
MRECDKNNFVIGIMNKIHLFIFISCLIPLLFSCNNSDSKKLIKHNKINRLEINDTLVNNDFTKNDAEFYLSNIIIGKNYDIEYSEIIRVGPGENYEKLINKKASENFDKIIFASVDGSVKVKVEEINGIWAKIRIIEPDWLNNHIGWIHANNIIGENKTDKKFLKNLNKNLLLTLLTNINNNKYVDSVLCSNNFHKELNGFYKSNEKIDNRSKHILFINNLGEQVIFHTSDSLFWNRIIKELKGIRNQEIFYEGSYIGKRFISDKYIFESLQPKQGVDIIRNIFYDLYLYKRKK